MTTPVQNARRLLLCTSLAYLAFIVYGSLVPLQFRYREWDDAWHAFLHVPYLQLGIASRADWISNIVLYVPLTFLLRSWLGRRRAAATDVLASLAVFVPATALAFAVEFIQLYFPQRTVSQNDLIAETIGSAIGVLLWHAAGTQIADALRAVLRRGSAAAKAALTLYLICYVGFSLFPFDFVTSADELARHLADGGNALFFSSASCKGTMRCSAQLSLELLAVVPAGFLLAWLRRYRDGGGILAACIAGAGLGAAVEGAQMFLHSGVAQGLSILTRAGGAALGAAIVTHFGADTGKLRDAIRGAAGNPGAVMSATLAYLAVLAASQGWKAGAWLDADQALARLSDVHFMPFYYHYFTTEAAAVLSLWFTLAVYAPAGALRGWAEQAGRPKSIGLSAFIAGALAVLMESIRLFQPQTHPDPTNVLIAATAAAAAHAVARWLLRPATAVVDAEPAMREYDASRPAVAEHAGASPRMSMLAISGGIAALAAAALHPFAPALLAAVLLTIFLLRAKPAAWLVLLPALLPVLDLAPWSGRFFLDEFDCLLLATLTAARVTPAAGRRYRLSLVSAALLALSLLAFAASAAIGALPFPGLDANAFNSYYSPYNVLRIGKGLLWALLLLPLLRTQLDRDAGRSGRLLCLGMTLGVATCGISVMWERIAFTGLVNFTDAYRVSGMFSAMHTGGANIEAWLVMGMPFTAWWALTTRHWLRRALGAGVFLLGSYAMVVTYARGGYLALMVAMAVMAAFVFMRSTASIRRARPLAVTVVLTVMCGSAWLLTQGTFIQSRFSNSQHDLDVRSALWKRAVDMMDDTAGTQLFGMGLGRYPEIYFWRNTEGVRPAAYGFKTERGNTYLLLSSGSPLYFEQIVDVQPHRRYRLSFFARSHSKMASLSVSLCEKWMLYSTNCAMQVIHTGDTGGAWKPFATILDSGAIADRPWYAQRTAKLSLFTQSDGTAVAVDGVSLIADDGQELLKNGDFSGVMDHWFFSTDNHHPWHLENLWVQLYFEQGVFGLCVFSLLAIYAFALLTRRSGEHELPAPALAGALAGVLSLGMVDSVFDFPRMIMLVYFVCIWIMLRRKEKPGRIKDA